MKIEPLKTPAFAGLACLLAISCFAAASGSQEASWSANLERGDKALESEKPNEAVRLYRTALSLAKKNSKQDSELDKITLKLAAALTLAGKPAEARALLEKLLSSLNKKDASSNTRIRPVLMKLGSIEESAGNHSLAMDYYNRALQISEKDYGPYSPEAAGALQGLGSASGKAGNKDAAALHYKRAITILSADPNREAAEQLKVLKQAYSDLIKGGDDSDKSLIRDFQKDVQNGKETSPSGWHDKRDQMNGSATQGSGITTNTQSKFAEESQFRLKATRAAETAENTQVALRGIIAPASDQTLKPAFNVLSDTLFNQSRYLAGESQYKRMIATDIDSLGPNHPSVGNDLCGLAQIYLAEKRFAEAKSLFIRALSIYESTYGAKNMLSINTSASLAYVESQLGNFKESLDLYNRALAGAQEILGPGDIETARILNGLAYLYFQHGMLDKSSTVYEWAVASTERALGPKDPLLAACLRDYAQVLRRLEKNEKAGEIETRADQLLRK